MEIIDLNKKVYNKNQYKKVIDTNFSQLGSTLTREELEQLSNEPPITINEFFDYYNQLFFIIPKTGENSHETLIKRSSEYINFTPTDAAIQVLIEEINSLQKTNLELNQQIIELSLTGSQQ